jgi:enoyl-CoA hydratase/carnithine racemase
MAAHALAVGVPFIYAPPYDNPITSQTTLGILPGSGGSVQLDAQVIPGGAWYLIKTFSAAEIYSLGGKMTALRFTAATAVGAAEILG